MKEYRPAARAIMKNAIRNDILLIRHAMKNSIANPLSKRGRPMSTTYTYPTLLAQQWDISKKRVLCHYGSKLPLQWLTKFG